MLFKSIKLVFRKEGDLSKSEPGNLESGLPRPMKCHLAQKANVHILKYNLYWAFLS